jgi:cAMP-dependent protein kinase regulator
VGAYFGTATIEMQAPKVTGRRTNMSDSGTHFDPSVYAPAPAPGVTVLDRGPEEPEARFALVREGSGRVEVISEIDHRIWEMFDGERSVDNVCSQYLMRHRTLVMNRVFTLLQRLAAGGMLAVAPGIAGGKANPKIPVLDRIRITIPGSTLVAKALGIIASPKLCNLSSAIVFGIIALLGIVLTVTLPSELTLLPTSGDIATTVITLCLGCLVMGFLHQALRSGMTASFSGWDTPVQLGIYLGIPVFLHNPKWRQTLPRAQRLVAGVSGLVLETTLATLCAILLHAGIGHDVLYTVLAVFYIRVFLHLLPLVRNDFNDILREWGNIRRLRRRSLGFLRHNLFDAFFGDARLTREQHVYLAFNIALLAWVVIAFRLGGAIFTSSELEQLVLTAGASGTSSAKIVIWLVLLPFALSAGAGIAWGGSALFSWVRKLPIVTRTASLGWLLVAFIYIGGLGVATRANLISGQTEAHALLLAVVLATVLGIRSALDTIGQTRGSAWAVRTWLIAGSIAAASVAQLLGALNSAPGILKATYIVMAACIVLALMLGLFKRQSLLHLSSTGFLLPELTLLVGAAILCVLCRSQTQALGHLDPVRLQRGALIGITLIALALDASRRLLGQLRTPQKSLAIRNPAKSLVKSVSRATTFAVNAFAEIIGDRFGTGQLVAIASDVRRAGVADFQFANFAAAKGEVQAVSEQSQKLLLALHGSLVRQFGAPFAARVYDGIFSEIHWQVKAILHAHVLAGTPWADSFRNDLAVGGAQRREVIDNISIFRDFSVDEKQLIVGHLRYQRFAAGELIIEQGTQGNACYLTLSGEVQVEERDIAGQDRILAFLHENDLFGESALLEDVARKASVRATTDTVLLSLSKADFLRFGEQHLGLLDKIRTRLHNMHLLIKIPLFGDVAPNLLRLILPHVTSQVSKRGETIVRQGDIGREFFIIRSGKVKVYAASETGEAPICELGPREYFGEIALLKEIPRTATVRSLRETELLVLNKEIFTRLIHGSELFASNVAAMGDGRLLNTSS